MIAAFNYLDATLDTDNTTNDEHDGPLDYPHANTDTDANFQEEEE
eukprot:CAMPEP_0170961286 /NCGR_PEP_ID=MMETSP0735-20130129/37907_1 /TAXON_ID=186038 /ORGANISM="Fragilariopsis kerguelensis, Strain L26-C5" /LENGTH=44 /DNA_ID= /DNA_START= /DNA_END= /DNA_ORIENTATION=